jgi:transcriptional regulator with XRE-family HTH domain
MSEAVAERLENIRQRGGIKSREIAQLLGTTPETVSRWKAGRVYPQSDRLKLLLALEWLVGELAGFYEPEEARLWLFSPHKLLGGKTPAERIQKGHIDDVLAIIAQLEDGAYA